MARFSKPDIHLCGAAAIWGMRGQQSGCPIVSAGCQHRCVSQNPRQITVGIKIVSFSSFNHAVDHRTALRPARYVGKEEILSANHKWLSRSLRHIVVRFQTAIFRTTDQIRPLFFQIVRSFAKRGFQNDSGESSAAISLPCKRGPGAIPLTSWKSGHCPKLWASWGKCRDL